MLAASNSIGLMPGGPLQDRLWLPGLPGQCLVCKGKINNDLLVGYRGLMAAIINQARIDAIHGDQEALDWLVGEVCSDFCITLGFEHANILDWITEVGLKRRVGNKV